MALKKLCNRQGCRTLIDKGQSHCDEHKPQRTYDNMRGTAHERGYDVRWRRYREVFLKGHPLCECEECKNNGWVYPATVVDHIIPHKGDRDLFWDSNNHQAMYKPHHDKKTASEDGGFGNSQGGRGV